jgi:hypothetical protein
MADGGGVVVMTSAFIGDGAELSSRGVKRTPMKQDNPVLQ